MATTWIWIIVIAIAVWCLIWRGAKGLKYNLESLYGPIDDLLQLGYDTSFLVIEFPYSRKFVQLKKYINSDTDHGIEFMFPKAKWSIKYFDDIETFCITNKIPYSIKKNTYQKHTLDFLYIDFAKDTERAYDIVKRILVEIFGADEKARFFALLER